MTEISQYPHHPTSPHLNGETYAQPLVITNNSFNDFFSLASKQQLLSSHRKSTETSKSFSADNTQSVVIDIRDKNADSSDLKTAIIDGLVQPSGEKSLSSFLLWGEKGQQYYDEILSTGYYYPYRVENELLQQRIGDVAKRIQSSGCEVVVELGAGNLQKTALLLRTLDKMQVSLTYYALDLDQESLCKSIRSLKERTHLHYVKLHGLLGTYEDGSRWLSTAAEVRNKSVTLVWLGNSIANFKPQEASDMLGMFTETNDIQQLRGLILAIDGCQDPSMIECAYDLPGGQSRHWVKSSLEAARDCFGLEAGDFFDDDNWRVEGQWYPETRRYENHLCAARSLSITLKGRHIRIQRGEKVHILGSGKWSHTDVDAICAGRHLKIVDWWNSTEVDYGIYWLEPTQ